jgi:hypothetical protein
VELASRMVVAAEAAARLVTPWTGASSSARNRAGRLERPNTARLTCDRICRDAKDLWPLSNSGAGCWIRAVGDGPDY